eukprot:Seg2831.2 transcript_id=Seg2831.2/GoldUCD/mRNA.D3Y31 product="hypothetical protein" protein_id=Seg2831.2/GoldUCD/D3Y31
MFIRQITEGGRYKTGSGRSHGEDCEIVNSMISSASAVTRRMSPEVREEYLTELVLKWNQRRIMDLPQMLVKRQKDVVKSKDESLRELKQFLADESIPFENVEYKMWLVDLQNYAREKKEAVNNCRIHTRIQKYCLICAELVAIDSLPTSIDVENKSELKNLDRYYIATLLAKRPKRSASKVDGLKQKAMDMHNEFGLPDQTTINDLKSKISSSIRYQVFSKQLSLENLTANAKKISDTCKEYTRLMKNARKTKAELQELLDTYNELAQDLHKEPINSETLRDNIDNDSSHTSEGLSMASKRHVVDRMLFNERCKEELEFLSTEKCNYLKYFANIIIPSLEQRREQVIESLQQTSSPGSCKSSEMADGNAGTQLPLQDSCTPKETSIKYEPSSLDASNLKGLLALLNDGIGISRHMLKNGYDHFTTNLVLPGESPPSTQVENPAPSGESSPSTQAENQAPSGESSSSTQSENQAPSGESPPSTHVENPAREGVPTSTNQKRDNRKEAVVSTNQRRQAKHEESCRDECEMIEEPAFQTANHAHCGVDVMSDTDDSNDGETSDEVVLHLTTPRYRAPKRIMSVPLDALNAASPGCPRSGSLRRDNCDTYGSAFLRTALNVNQISEGG